MHKFKELKVWQKSKVLAVEIYTITDKISKSERYGLIEQIRKDAVSIPSNIAEGAGRESVKDFSHFLDIALGSSFELETQLIIALEVEILKKEEYECLLEILVNIQNMLIGLRNNIRTRLN